MSVASQFFPSGASGGGGGSTNIGGGTIPVEIVGMAGGGGGGSGSCQPSCRTNGGASGGQGGFFHAKNYYLNPGTTYPITIGGGGGAGGGTPGSNGTHTSFNNPLCPIRVEGGGGGGSGTSPYASPYCRSGLPGGSGGGAGAPGGSIGEGLYFSKTTTAINTTKRVLGGTCTGPAPGNFVGCMLETTVIDIGQNNSCPWGYTAGFPGAPAYTLSSGSFPACSVAGGNGGTAASNYITVCNYSPYSTSWNACASQTGSCRIYSNITGNTVGYGETIGTGGGVSSSGAAGALIIRWPSTVGAAPPSGFPGGTNISPQTPGYYTYCFTSSGSITLP